VFGRLEAAPAAGAAGAEAVAVPVPEDVPALPDAVPLPLPLPLDVCGLGDNGARLPLGVVGVVGLLVLGLLEPELFELPNGSWYC
jgi:hypothetical protein